MKQDVNTESMAARFRLPCGSTASPGRLPWACSPAITGLWMAGLIGGSWLGHLAWLLGPAAVREPVASLAGAGMTLGHILLQTFLTTGLFVTVHDAVHGLVSPGHPKLNRALGCCFATAYAGLSYEQLCQNHWLHHSAPMAASDPDAHPGVSALFWSWYFKFLSEYWGLNPFLKLTLFLFVLLVVGHVSALSLVMFWGIPLCLSSLQLFYFGTYRPHRGPHRDTHRNTHRDTMSRSRSASCTPSPAWPWLMSLVTCYHFSYHQEHHDHLGVAWWALPSLYRWLKAQGAADIPSEGKFKSLPSIFEI